jgi:hypothetical protein
MHSVRVAVVGAVLLGCGGWAKGPATETATVTFVKGYKETLRPVRSQTYTLAVRATCDSRGLYKQAAFIFPGRTRKSHKVAAGAPVEISGSMTSAMPTNMRFAPNASGTTMTYEMDRTNCYDFAAFTVEGGHSYTVHQEWQGERCMMSVVDDATGRPPADLARSGQGPTQPDCGA